MKISGAVIISAIALAGCGQKEGLPNADVIHLQALRGAAQDADEHHNSAASTNALNELYSDISSNVHLSDTQRRVLLQSITQAQAEVPAVNVSTTPTVTTSSSTTTSTTMMTPPPLTTSIVSVTIDNDSADFAFSSNNPDATFQCQLDHGKWKPCQDNSVLYTGLATGTHVFQVRAVVNGVVDAHPAAHQWVVVATTTSTTTVSTTSTLTPVTTLSSTTTTSTPTTTTSSTTTTTSTTMSPTTTGTTTP